MGFFDWWFGELRKLFGLARTPRRRSLRNAFILREEPGRFEVAKLNDGTASTVGWLNLANPRDALNDKSSNQSSLLQKLRKARQPVILRLSVDHGLSVDEYLPVPNLADLNGIVRHRVDYVSPWSNEEAYHDHEILEFKGHEQALVRIAIAPKTIVNRLTDQLARLGITIGPVDIEGDERWAPPSFDLRNTGKVRAKRSGAVLVWLLLGAALAAGFAVSFDAFRQANSQFTERRDYLTALSDRVADLPNLVAEVEEKRVEAAFAGLEKAAYPSATVLIEALSRVLPEDSWLEEFSINEQSVNLTGFAADPSTIPALLEASQYFTDIEFQSSGNRQTIEINGSETAEFERFVIDATSPPLWRLP